MGSDQKAVVNEYTPDRFYRFSPIKQECAGPHPEPSSGLNADG
jgi:hypothetical protein